MERRRIREGGLPFSMAQRGTSSGQEDSEDEFFDCPEEDVEGELINLLINFNKLFIIGFSRAC